MTDRPYADIGDPLDEIIDAIREITTDVDANDREIPTLIVLEWLMSGNYDKTNERLLRWAWDRYVEQPKRDALKFSDADKGTDVGDDRASDDSPAEDSTR